MEILLKAWDLIRHINDYLEIWVQQYPVAVYAILFAIIFAETGLVVTPFLPGDSLLFAVGAISARPEMDVGIVSLFNSSTLLEAETTVHTRFVPIVRTFAPFVAGSGRMDYSKFMFFNVVGAILWVVLIIPAGYFFGGLPVVRQNFELVVIGIIIVSLIPGLIGVLQARRAGKRAAIDTPAVGSD